MSNDGGADHLALVGDQHQRLALVRREGGDDAAVAFRRVDVGDALAAAVGAAIFIGRGALAVAVFGDGQDELLLLGKLGDAVGGKRAFDVLALAPRRAFQIGLALLLGGADALEDRHRDHLVAGRKTNAPDALRIARLELPDVGRLEANGLAVAGREQDVVLLGQQRHADQAIVGIAVFLRHRCRSASRACPTSRMLAKASMLLRRTVPRAVANMMCSPPHSASSSGSGEHGRNGLAFASGSRLTIGRPRVFGPPSGSRQTFIR